MQSPTVPTPNPAARSPWDRAFAPLQIAVLLGISIAALFGLRTIWDDREVTAPQSTAPKTDASGNVQRPSGRAPRGAATIYLVSSEEQAAGIRIEIDQDNALRSASGLAPTPDDVLVARTAPTAALFLAAIADGNRILDPARRDVRVVDLRSD